MNSRCVAVGLNMEKQAELIREKDELARLTAEMKLEDDEKKRWYANPGCTPHREDLCSLKNAILFHLKYV